MRRKKGAYRKAALRGCFSFAESRFCRTKYGDETPLDKSASFFPAASCVVKGAYRKAALRSCFSFAESRFCRTKYGDETPLDKSASFF
ncbi:MAG: hypothetical protein DBX93_02020, partial [Oscillospiraceae bacterium]